MDGIIDLDLIKTGQILKLDRILILRLKYQENPPVNSQTKIIPQANLENIFDWSTQLPNNYETSVEYPVYQLRNSALISYAWKIAPDLTIIEGKKQLNKWNLEADITNIFDANHLNSLLIIPLFRQSESKKIIPIIIGFLVLQNYKTHTWEPAEIETGKWIAKQITTSIINQQTLEKVQSLVDERTSQLQVSLKVQAKLSQKMRDYIEELQYLNTLKDEFLSSLSDALKTPLSNMKMGIKMLKLMNISEKSIDYLNILEQECDKEINLVNNLLTLEKIKAKQLAINPKKIEFNYFIKNLYRDFSQALHQKDIKLTINSYLDNIYTDLESISLILKELINNACKFSLKQTEINLQVYNEQKNYIIKIENHGTVIDKDEQELIFEPFYQGKQVDNVTNSGTGLGLALVKSLVENLNGTIECSSTYSAKSSSYLNIFTVKFPQLPIA